MNTNFTFLTEMFPELEKTGSLAEGYLYSDPNTCLFKLGAFAEIMVNYMFDLDNLEPPETDNTHANRLRTLWQAGYLPQDINDIFYVLRKKRNDAVHLGYDSLEACKTLLQLAHTLSVWFMQVKENVKTSAVKISALGAVMVHFGHGKPVRNRNW